MNPKATWRDFGKP